MTYIVKTRLSPTVVALFTCPAHGVFELEAYRDPNGDAPEFVCCPETECTEPSQWTASADVACRVNPIEVVRGKWEKPERKTYLDTRKLGEGQPIEEFQAERKKIWREERHKRVKEMLK